MGGSLNAVARACSPTCVRMRGVLASAWEGGGGERGGHHGAQGTHLLHQSLDQGDVCLESGRLKAVNSR